MIQTIRKAWGIPELRKKIIFTLLILLIFRIGNAITVPYVDVGLLETYLDQMGGTILGLYNVMSGGAFAQATVFALSIQPYINASIIIQAGQGRRGRGQEEDPVHHPLYHWRHRHPAGGRLLFHDAQLQPAGI